MRFLLRLAVPCEDDKKWYTASRRPKQFNAAAFSESTRSRLTLRKPCTARPHQVCTSGPDQHCCKSALKEMAAALVPQIKPYPVGHVYPLHRIYREYRRREKLPVQPINGTMIEELPDETGDQVIGMDPEQLQHCLEIISPELREAPVLRFFEDMSYEEIARVTGVTVGTVRIEYPGATY